MTRQTEEPKGSAMMPPSPLLENSTDTESTLSAPNQPRQLRRHRRPARRLVAERPQQPLHSDLLAHPILEERLGGGPQVEVGVELAPEPLDVEQRLLQHDELRLDLNVEAPRGLE